MFFRLDPQNVSNFDKNIDRLLSSLLIKKPELGLSFNCYYEEIQQIEKLDNEQEVLEKYFQLKNLDQIYLIHEAI